MASSLCHSLALIRVVSPVHAQCSIQVILSPEEPLLFQLHSCKPLNLCSSEVLPSYLEAIGMSLKPKKRGLNVMALQPRNSGMGSCSVCGWITRTRTSFHNSLLLPFFRWRWRIGCVSLSFDGSCRINRRTRSPRSPVD